MLLVLGQPTVTSAPTAPMWRRILSESNVEKTRLQTIYDCKLIHMRLTIPEDAQLPTNIPTNIHTNENK